MVDLPLHERAERLRRFIRAERAMRAQVFRTNPRKCGLKLQECDQALEDVDALARLIQDAPVQEDLFGAEAET